MKHEPIEIDTQGLLLVGIDEVGRGCIAGHVRACAYSFLIQRTRVEGLRDSKKVSVKKRNMMVPILESVGRFGHGFSSAETIDRYGITVATFAAMREALVALQNKLAVSWDQICVVVDGNVAPPWDDLGLGKIICMPKADDLVAEVSAASVLAKVLRDKEMAEFNSLYPGYGFADHVGYGTAAHFAAIGDRGPCSLHRMTFEPLKSLPKGTWIRSAGP